MLSLAARRSAPLRLAPRRVEDNFRKTIGQLLGGAAVLLGAVLAYLQFSQQQQTSQQQFSRQQQASRELLISNQVSKGFEQLGSERVVVRLGGIYALEGVMNTSEQYHLPVLEALCALRRFSLIKTSGTSPSGCCRNAGRGSDNPLRHSEAKNELPRLSQSCPDRKFMAYLLADGSQSREPAGVHSGTSPEIFPRGEAIERREGCDNADDESKGATGRMRVVAGNGRSKRDLRAGVDASGRRRHQRASAACPGYLLDVGRLGRARGMDDEIYLEYRRLLEALALLERATDLAWPTLAGGLREEEPRAAVVKFCLEVGRLLEAVASSPKPQPDESSEIASLRSRIGITVAKLRRGDPSAYHEVPAMLFVLWSEMIDRLKIEERLAKRAAALRGADGKAVLKRVIKDCCAESGTETVTPNLRKVWQSVREVSLRLLDPEKRPSWENIKRNRYDMSLKARCTSEHFRKIVEYGRNNAPYNRDKDFPRTEGAVARVFHMFCSCCRGLVNAEPGRLGEDSE
jgi:hypothetical protein